MESKSIGSHCPQIIKHEFPHENSEYIDNVIQQQSSFKKRFRYDRPITAQNNVKSQTRPQTAQTAAATMTSTNLYQKLMYSQGECNVKFEIKPVKKLNTDTIHQALYKVKKQKDNLDEKIRLLEQNEANFDQNDFLFIKDKAAQNYIENMEKLDNQSQTIKNKTNNKKKRITKKKSDKKKDVINFNYYSINTQNLNINSTDVQSHKQYSQSGQQNQQQIPIIQEKINLKSKRPQTAKFGNNQYKKYLKTMNQEQFLKPTSAKSSNFFGFQRPQTAKEQYMQSLLESSKQGKRIKNDHILLQKEQMKQMQMKNEIKLLKEQQTQDAFGLHITGSKLSIKNIPKNNSQFQPNMLQNNNFKLDNQYIGLGSQTNLTYSVSANPKANLSKTAKQFFNNGFNNGTSNGYTSSSKIPLNSQSSHISTLKSHQLQFNAQNNFVTYSNFNTSNSQPYSKLQKPSAQMVQSMKQSQLSNVQIVESQLMKTYQNQKENKQKEDEFIDDDEEDLNKREDEYEEDQFEKIQMESNNNKRKLRPTTAKNK